MTEKKKERIERMQLPSHFKATHQTDGLPGYPAIDIFGDAGTVVLAPEPGVIHKWSGRAPTEHAKPGGPYGRSMYLRTATGDYFITHLRWRSPKAEVGMRVRRGQILGSLADYTGATNGRTPSHVHMGKKGTGVS
jgi:hypothetical protein